MFLPIYTKSFGGKIWKNLHSVSPGNSFGKKLNGVPLENFLSSTIKTRKETIQHLVQKIWNQPKF